MSHRRLADYFDNSGKKCVALGRSKTRLNPFLHATQKLLQYALYKLSWVVQLNRKYKTRTNGLSWGHVTYFWNFGTPLLISGTCKVKKFKFLHAYWPQEATTKNAKVGQRQSYGGHVDFEFWDSLNISGTVKAKNLYYSYSLCFYMFFLFLSWSHCLCDLTAKLLQRKSSIKGLMLTV